jgi:hypothetical protein
MEQILIINTLLSLAFISINTYILFRIVKVLNPSKPEKKAPVKRNPRKSIASAKNNVAVNSTVDFQKIRTAEITVPVIAEDVLTYGPGELGAAYPETTNLYYPEEAISDKEYLETVLRSPFQVQTHEKNTSEWNRDVDGWPQSAWYDSTLKKVFAKGILHGEENVKYAKENLSKPGFGTSAFISFLKIEKQKGTAPNGKPYDAIVKKAVNNHTAILPNIRDSKNVIVALNAVENTVSNGNLEKPTEPASNANNNSEDKTMTQDEFNSMMDNYNAKNKDREEMKNSIKNELIEEFKTENSKNGKNSDDDKKEDKKETENTKNSDDDKDKKEDDKSEASNALPSDEMLKDFSNHLGITFKSTPTLKSLGEIVGVEAKNTAELISALNAKRKEFSSAPAKKETVEGKNSNNEKASFDELLKNI